MGHQEDFLDKQLREKEEDQLLYEQTLEQLRTEERFINFFKNYNATSVQSFIKFYAQQKVNWHRNKGNFGRYAQLKLQQKRKEVVDLFKQLMEKKVFNLQCRWVAGEMDLEGIDQTTQFGMWKNNPVLLKAAGSIHADEFYWFLDSFERGIIDKCNEDGYIDRYARSAINCFHLFRGLYDDAPHDYIPEWFYDYDQHFGTEDIYFLPLVRRNLEQEHLELWTKEIQYPSLTPEQQKNYRSIDLATRKRLKEDPLFRIEWEEESLRLLKERDANRPEYEYFSVYDQKIMAEVVSAIEPRDSQKAYRFHKRWKEIRDNDDTLFTEVEYLKDVHEYVAVSPSDDYAQSIKEAYKRHSRQTTYQALILLFEEYETCQRTGVAFDWGPSVYQGSHEEERSRILAVRKLKGLPENFDFMKKENLP